MTAVIFFLCFIVSVLLSACSNNEQEDKSGSVQKTSPSHKELSSQEYGIKKVKINQDLTLKENTHNIAGSGYSYTHPIYYGNSKCVLWPIYLGSFQEWTHGVKNN